MTITLSAVDRQKLRDQIVRRLGSRGCASPFVLANDLRMPLGMKIENEQLLVLIGELLTGLVEDGVIRVSHDSRDKRNYPPHQVTYELAI